MLLCALYNSLGYNICCLSFGRLPGTPGIDAWAYYPLFPALSRAWALGNPCLSWGSPTRSGDRVSRAPLQTNMFYNGGEPNSVHYEDDIVSGFIRPTIMGTYFPGSSISGLGQIMTVKFISVGFLSKGGDIRGMSIVMHVYLSCHPKLCMISRAGILALR